jgi:hypothetical protein
MTAASMSSIEEAAAVLANQGMSLDDMYGIANVTGYDELRLLDENSTSEVSIPIIIFVSVWAFLGCTGLFGKLAEEKKILLYFHQIK